MTSRQGMGLGQGWDRLEAGPPRRSKEKPGLGRDTWETGPVPGSGRGTLSGMHDSLLSAFPSDITSYQGQGARGEPATGFLCVSVAQRPQLRKALCGVSSGL